VRIALATVRHHAAGQPWKAGRTTGGDHQTRDDWHAARVYTIVPHMRVLHVMVYDGPGGYCRVIFDLCRLSQRRTPSVAVFAERAWTHKLRGLGIRVASVDRIMMRSSMNARLEGLAKLTRDVDLVNIHVGPHFDDALKGFAELGAPHVYTLHWPL